MDDHIIGSLNTAVNKFTQMAGLVNRSTKDYADHYDNLLARVDQLARNGRAKRARKLRKELEKVKPL